MERLKNGPGVPLLRPFFRSRADVGEGQLSHGSMHRDTVYRRVLALADLAAVAVALVLAVTVVGNDTLTAGALAVLPVLVLLGKAGGLYDRDEHLLRKSTLDEAPVVFQVATLGAVVTWLAAPVLVDGSVGRDQLVALWALLFVCMVAARAAARRSARALTSEERCLMLGDVSASEWANRKLETSGAVNARLIGCVTLHPGAAPEGLPALGTLESLTDIVAEHDVDRVIIAPEGTDSDEMLDVIRLVKAHGVKVSVLPRLFEVVGSTVEFDDVDGMMLLGVRRYGLTTSSQLLKRSMDVLGSLLLLVLLAPLLAFIAIAVKVTSRGRVLFRQPRVGRDDCEFEMFKFRTMYEGADDHKADLHDRNEAGGGLFKIAEDPRVTQVGRFLRRTSLDELPQLFNVLRGDMSLVGPRPLVADEDRQVEGWQRRRLHVPPGMTGLWQVFGSSRIPLDEMVKIDYLYGANWSLWSDIKILFRTLPYVVGRKGM